MVHNELPAKWNLNKSQTLVNCIGSYNMSWRWAELSRALDSPPKKPNQKQKNPQETTKTQQATKNKPQTPDVLSVNPRLSKWKCTWSSEIDGAEKELPSLATFLLAFCWQCWEQQDCTAILTQPDSSLKCIQFCPSCWEAFRLLKQMSASS